MTSEQHQVSNAWARGSDWYPIQKVSKGWIIAIDETSYWKPVGTYQPNVFKTKRAAIDFFSNLCLFKFREWREAPSPLTGDIEIPRTKPPKNWKAYE